MMLKNRQGLLPLLMLAGCLVIAYFYGLLYFHSINWIWGFFLLAIATYMLAAKKDVLFISLISLSLLVGFLIPSFASYIFFMWALYIYAEFLRKESGAEAGRKNYFLFLIVLLTLAIIPIENILWVQVAATWAMLFLTHVSFPISFRLQEKKYAQYGDIFICLLGQFIFYKNNLQVQDYAPYVLAAFAILGSFGSNKTLSFSIYTLLLFCAFPTTPLIPLALFAASIMGFWGEIIYILLFVIYSAVWWSQKEMTIAQYLALAPIPFITRQVSVFRETKSHKDWSGLLALVGVIFYFAFSMEDMWKTWQPAWDHYEMYLPLVYPVFLFIHFLMTRKNPAWSKAFSEKNWSESFWKNTNVKKRAPYVMPAAFSLYMSSAPEEQKWKFQYQVLFASFILGLLIVVGICLV
jgi:hypothetical protein